MGKLQNLFYSVTRGKNTLKPWEHGPAKSILTEKCGCNGNCQCNSIESLEKAAGISKKVSIKVIPATVDGTAASIPKVPTEIREHLIEEGHVKPARKSKLEQVKEDSERMKKQLPAVEGINKKVEANKKASAKKPVAKTTEKKMAIKQDIADQPVVKKASAKKSDPKKK